MSLIHSPNVIMDGLAFYYDMGNAKKSWKGKPTTNLANVGLNGMSGVSLSFLGIEDGWKKYSMSGTFTGGTYPYVLNITSVSFTGGVTYSSACYVKTNAQAKFNYFGTGMNYVNVPMNKGGTSIGVLQSDGSYYCGRSNFEYTGTTTQLGYILSNPINNTTFNAATDFVWIKEGQVELGEFPTPFAGDAATRSNTQAIVDLTGNNTVTANSLVYASDGTFSISGADGSNISIANIDLRTSFTLECWVYLTALQGAFFGHGVITVQQGLHLTISSNYTRFGMYGNDTDFSLPHTTGVWAHYVFTYNHGTYVKGAYRNTVSYTGTPIQTQTPYTATSNTLRIGQNYSSQPGGGMIGKVGLAKMYNRVLSQAEIIQNFNAHRGRYGL